MTGYREIFADISKRIQNSELKAGDKIPSVREISRLFDVNVNTALKACTELKRGGYIIPNGRHGSTVGKEWSSPGAGEQNPNRQNHKKSFQKPLKLGIITYWDRNKEQWVTNRDVVIERLLCLRCYEAGGSVQRFVCDRANKANIRAVLKKVGESSLDALVILCLYPELDPEAQKILKKNKVVVNYIDSTAYTALVSCDSVVLDDAWAFKEICCQLWRRGHENIAFVGLKSDEGQYDWSRLRAEAFFNTLKELGGRKMKDSFFLVSQEFETDKLVGRLDKFTAVVCANDEIANHLIADLRKHKLRVPEDISVTGYDNKRPAFLTDSELTTFAPPEEDTVNSIIELVENGLKNTSASRRTQVFLNPVLVARSSWKAINKK
ncbi:MAG: substrate-binding domain-containing protein [Victivallales bacterium]